jgi:hypothetical protein
MQEIKTGRVNTVIDFTLPDHVRYRPITPKSKACLGYTGHSPHVLMLEIPLPSMINKEFIFGFAESCKDSIISEYRGIPVQCVCTKCNPGSTFRYIALP